MTKRQKQARQTKRLIFDTAVELFNEKGYEQVTIEEITRRAGVAKGSFYTYFNSKSEIVIQEFHDIDEYYRRYAVNLKRYDSALERISRFNRAQMRYVRDRVGIKLLKLLYVNNISIPESEDILIDTSRYLHTLMRELIAYGQERGEIRGDLTADQLAMYFNRAMRSVFLDWAISDAGFDLAEEGVRFYEIVVAPALRSSPGSVK